MILITGDTHREFNRLSKIQNNDGNVVIILGDACINYFLDDRDIELKKYLNDMNIPLFCIQGNHEERPENISSYEEKTMFGGKVFVEKEFPNLIFAKNGELYTIDGKSVLVIGGAYSIDKEYRLLYGSQWFSEEQLSEEEKKEIFSKYKGKHVDIILSHTCPLKYEPTEAFLEGFDQSKVDKSMEKFLDKIEENVDYDKWYCGHYHIEKKIDKLEFMFGRIKVFGKDEFYPKYDENGYEMIRDYCRQDDVFNNSEVCCPKCNGKNIVIQKGDGETIYGFDTIAVICEDCKKVYGFSDVNYKNGCPKEL